jgi:hypothetical protein
MSAAAAIPLVIATTIATLDAARPILRKPRSILVIVNS